MLGILYLIHTHTYLPYTVEKILNQMKKKNASEANQVAAKIKELLDYAPKKLKSENIMETENGYVSHSEDMVENSN